MNTSLPYEYQESEKTDEGVKYFFVSKGKRDVVKVIHYMCSATMNDRKVFNLGFGDYELEKDIIDDKMNTDNGDVYKVFNTVLYTIPVFFEAFPNSTILVQGSDSDHDFHENCRQTCKKKCEDLCKNQHRRINAYSNFVNKYYDALVKDYRFYGGVRTPKGVVIEDFVRAKKYDAVLVNKNNA
jgi:hypothetical protein